MTKICKDNEPPRHRNPSEPAATANLVDKTMKSEIVSIDISFYLFYWFFFIFEHVCLFFIHFFWLFLSLVESSRRRRESVDFACSHNHAKNGNKRPSEISVGRSVVKRHRQRREPKGERRPQVPLVRFTGSGRVGPPSLTCLAHI